MPTSDDDVEVESLAKENFLSIPGTTITSSAPKFSTRNSSCSEEPPLSLAPLSIIAYPLSMTSCAKMYGVLTATASFVFELAGVPSRALSFVLFFYR